MNWMESGMSLAAAVVMSAALGAQGMGGMNHGGQGGMDHGSMAMPAAGGETVSGCVARGEKAETYTLTNATRSGDKAGKKTETLLLSGAGVEFAKHVGHKVSVTGATSAPSKMDAMDHDMGAMDHGGQEAPSTFTVKSMKMIAASCP